ncbi:MAG: glutamate synthase-related protein [Candidatus Hodarchaeales archaeon]|jgi:hypothetical protein
MTELIRSQSDAENILKESIIEKSQSDSNNKIQLVKSNYKRFHIKIKHAPNRKGIPYPFYPKVKKFVLLKLLLTEIMRSNFKLMKKKYRTRLLARPCIYGVFSGKFGGFRPLRKRCVGCLRCVQEFPEFCTVDRNPKFLDYADTYWAPDSKSELASLSTPFSNVWFESETGKILIKGMGYKGSFSDTGWDTIWTDMSEIVRPTRDGVYGREYISTTIDIGRKNVLFNLNDNSQYNTIKQIKLPMIFDYLPGNLNSKTIAESIVKASSRVETFCLFTPDQIQKYALSLLSSQNIGIYVNKDPDSEALEILKNAPFIELDYNLVGKTTKIRELNPNAPIIIRLPINKYVEESVNSLVKNRIDGIHLYADYHGNSFDETNSKFIIDYIRLIHNNLVENGIRDQISIIVSGGIILAEHVPKAIICGADLVGIDTSTLVALQTRIIGECTSSITGKIKQKKISVNWGSQRLVNLFSSWYNQIIEVLSAMGIRDIRRLRGEVGRAIFKAEIEKEAFNDIEGFGG